MVLGVADVDEVLVLSEDVAQSLWVVKLHFAIRTVNESHLPVAHLLLELHRFFIDYQHTVITGV